MKICKNCGQQTDDGKVRCPYCGFLFEDNMDDVLRKMKSTLKNYRKEESARAAQQKAAAPSPAAASAPAAPARAAEGERAQGAPAARDPRERFELLSEVAQLKGEVRVLQGEVDRLHGSRQPGVQPLPSAYLVSPRHNAAPQAAQEPARRPRRTLRTRSVNRIVLSFLGAVLLAVSMCVFSFAWVRDISLDAYGGSMSGYQALVHLFSQGDTGARGFVGVLVGIMRHEYASSELINGICRDVCRFVVRWGTAAYAVCLLCSLPLLVSIGGKIRLGIWHSFWAWISFLVSLAVFAALCWTFGFSSLTVAFMVGVGANLVRAVLLCFYRQERYYEGGLQ